MALEIKRGDREFLKNKTSVLRGNKLGKIYLILEMFSLDYAEHQKILIINFLDITRESRLSCHFDYLSNIFIRSLISNIFSIFFADATKSLFLYQSFFFGFVRLKHHL